MPRAFTEHGGEDGEVWKARGNLEHTVRKGEFLWKGWARRVAGESYRRLEKAPGGRRNGRRERKREREKERERERDKETDADNEKTSHEAATGPKEASCSRERE